jgi:hypothetical protein
MLGTSGQVFTPHVALNFVWFWSKKVKRLRQLQAQVDALAASAGRSSDDQGWLAFVTASTALAAESAESDALAKYFGCLRPTLLAVAKIVPQSETFPSVALHFRAVVLAVALAAAKSPAVSRRHVTDFLRVSCGLRLCARCRGFPGIHHVCWYLGTRRCLLTILCCPAENT